MPDQSKRPPSPAFSFLQSVGLNVSGKLTSSAWKWWPISVVVVSGIQYSKRACLPDCYQSQQSVGSSLYTGSLFLQLSCCISLPFLFFGHWIQHLALAALMLSWTEQHVLSIYFLSRYWLTHFHSKIVNGSCSKNLGLMSSTCSWSRLRRLVANKTRRTFWPCWSRLWLVTYWSNLSLFFLEQLIKTTDVKSLKHAALHFLWWTVCRVVLSMVLQLKSFPFNKVSCS